jgi:hypothetical protein
VIHVPWEWSLFCLSHCRIHRKPLLQGCPACCEPDPLTFTGPDSSGSALCRSCDGYFGAYDADAATVIRAGNEIQAFEDAYRATLLGAPPVLLPKTTAPAFWLFVEEMLQLLSRSLNCGSGRRSRSFSRQDMLAIIAALVWNAAPHPDQAVQHRRPCGLRLWATLLSIIPEREGATIERTSIRWPVTLRRRFLSGLHYRSQKRWPYTPYRAATHLGKPVDRAEMVAVFGLPAKMRVKESLILSGI